VLLYYKKLKIVNVENCVETVDKFSVIVENCVKSVENFENRVEK